jgi:hypothetical protein
MSRVPAREGIFERVDAELVSSAVRSPREQIALATGRRRAGSGRFGGVRAGLPRTSAVLSYAVVTVVAIAAPITDVWSRSAVRQVGPLSTPCLGTSHP